MKFKNLGKKKVFIAASLIGLILIGAIVSIVVVFAASIQNTETNIKLTYVVNGVGAKVSANYAVLPNDQSQTVSATAMTTDGSNTTIEFKPSGGTQTANLQPAGDLILTTKKQRAVIEYIFENTADSAFSITLANKPTGVNMTERYYATGTRLDESEYREAITSTEFIAPQAMTYYGQKCYVYIMIEVSKANKLASYTGEFKWELEKQEVINITLNTDGIETSLPIIPTSTVRGIAMPVLNGKQNIGVGLNYYGYYDAEDGAGTQYIKANGASAHEADLTVNDKLYAYTEGMFIVEETTITGLTEKGEEATELVIPNNVTAIGERALEGSIAEKIIYEGAEGTIVYSDGRDNLLTSIGANAFANCTNLKEIKFPSSVTSFGTTPLAGCTALEEIEFPYRLGNGTSSVSAFSKLFGTANTAVPGTLKTVAINGGTSIGSYAFRITSDLISIEISSSITSIGNYAFYNSSGLTSITIPESVTSIGTYAFQGCSNITSINIPEGVTSIGNYAFSGCSSLTEVNITRLEAWCKITFGYSSANPTYYAKGLTLNGTLLTEIEIPETITKINSAAFYNCSSLTSINIPKGVTSIGNSAFYNCSGLTSINIPEGVTSIGSDTFNGCIGLTSVTFAENSKLTSIGDSVFYGCRNLTSINIPEGVTSIGGSAFYDCRNLTSINIPSSVTHITIYAFVGCSSLTEVNITSLEAWCKITFGYSSANPTYYAKGLTLNGTLLKEIEIPETITKINDYAFYNCSSLTSINIPKGVTSIGSHAFDYCSGLTSITIPESVTSMGTYAFSGCSKLTSVSIPEGVTSIGTYAFSGCSKLTSVSIPEGVTSIGSYAFYNCSGLTSVSIPQGVTSIGDSAFYNCSGLNSIVVDEENSVYNSGNGSNCIIVTATNTLILGCNTTTIPNSVTSIGSSVFYGCRNLTSINIPEGVTSIGSRAFYNCSGLTSINIPSSVTSIESYVFYGCSRLTSINIPEGVTSIGTYAFYDCSGLTSVSIPSSVTSIGTYAFSYCSIKEVNITSVEAWCNITFGSSDANPTYYAKGLTLNGTLLTEIEIPETITKINAYAFYGCSSLTSVSIPSSVTSIGSSAFSNCSSLVHVRNLSGKTMSGYTAPSYAEVRTDDSAFTTTLEIDSKYAIFIGTDGVKRLLTATDKAITTANDIPSDVTVINDYAFYACRSLTSISIPDGVTSIGTYAFYNCRSLTSVSIPISVTSIGNYALQGCNKLESLEFPYLLGDGTSSVSAFSKLFGTSNSAIPSTLTTVVINGGTSIGSYAFRSCSSLISVSIPSSVTSIGTYAFNDCSKLAEVNITSLEAWCNITFGNNYANPTNYASGLTLNGILLTEIEIPETITKINAYAFQYCISLTSITIPSSVTSIGSDAFYGCSSLVQVRNLSGKTMSGYTAPSYAEVKTSNTAFTTTLDIGSKYAIFIGKDGVKRLLTVTDRTITTANDIPSDVTVINDRAFYKCSSLTSIEIPEGITSIGEYAFFSCSSLISVTFAENSQLTSIGNSAFNSCSSLTEVNITSLEAWCKITFGDYYANPTNYAKGLTLNGALLTELEIPETITKINAYAFYNCSSLTSITIPSNVTSIGSSAFSNCSGLKEVNITSLEAWCNITFSDYYANPTYYAKGLTLNGTLLTEIVIPETITEVKANTFCNCSGLTSINIPSSITSIGSSAFSGCSGLKEVNITSLEAWCKITFGNTYANPTNYAKGLTLNGTLLTEIEIPETITKINACAFYGCISLTSITIPSNVTSIGSSAFSNCSGLKEVNITSLEAWCNITFSDYYANPTYYAKGLTLNGTLLTEIVIPETITKINAYAFYNCSSLTSITIPEGVTSIGSNAFYNCTALTEINWNAEKLSSTLSSSNSIFYNAGKNGSGITVNIGEEVEEIPAYLFYTSSSPNITSVVLPESSTWIRSTTKGATTGTSTSITPAYLLSTYYNYYFIRTDK